MPDEVRRIRETFGYYDRQEACTSRWAGSNPGNDRIVQERRDVIVSLLREHGFSELRKGHVLDVGCGYGGVLASLVNLGAQPPDLYGVDLLPDRVEAARREYPEINFTCGNAEQLEFSTAYFELVLILTVFSSILDQGMACNVAREVRRVLKPGGAVLWYDFRYNNPWNRHVQGMGKRKIRLLFPDFKFHLRTLTLFPPLARRLGPFMPVLYPLLATIPPLRTHYLGLLVKPIPDQ